MTKIPFLSFVLWFCLQLALPHPVPAQSASAQHAENSAETTRTLDAPEEKSTDESEPDTQLSEIVRGVDVNQQVVQIGGNYHLSPKEAVESLVVIGGNLTLRGKVSNDVLVLKGDVEVQEGAVVLGSVTTVLGKIRGKQYLEGIHREVNGWKFIPASAWLIMRPQEAWGMGKSAKFGWGVLVFIVLTLVHISVYAVFPQRLNTMAHIISRRPIGSTLLGLVVLIAAPCLITVLVLSIIGIPFVLLFISILLPIAIYGKTAIFLSMGANNLFPPTEGRSGDCGLLDLFHGDVHPARGLAHVPRCEHNRSRNLSQNGIWSEIGTERAAVRSPAPPSSTSTDKRNNQEPGAGLNAANPNSQTAIYVLLTANSIQEGRTHGTSIK